MQVLIPCLLILAVENVQLVRNERLGGPEILDSTQFKNAVAKELLKKKLSTLEAARQQDSLVTFLRKSGRNLTGLNNSPKSSFHKDDDPSRKQAQMANTFIASSNLLFGTKSQQRKACNTGKQTNKDVLDMPSLRQTYSGYNEDGNDFSVPKEVPKLALNTLNDSISIALQKRSYPKKASKDPISCYLTEPKKVTCTHKDIVYKIALPSSEVADDEIGRIVESIYRAVEGKSGGKASLDESIEGAGCQKTYLKDSAEATGSKKSSTEDSLKKKRASEDYLRSLFLNNLLVANHKALPNYNGNNPVFIPLLIPMAQPKLDSPKAAPGYYSGLALDPRLQIPMNSSAGADPVNSYQTGRNLMFENGYGQYLVPDGFALPGLNLKQRSQVNVTAEEEKRRNWLALMATNGLVPVENGVNPKVFTQHSANVEVQSVAEEKDSGNKLTVSETGEVLDKLLNKRQQRDTYFLRHQLRRNPIMEEKPTMTKFYEDGRKQVSTKVVEKLSDPGGYLWEEKKGCPCPSPNPPDHGPGKPIKCSPKFPANRLNSNLLFQPTNNQPSNDVKCCSSTTKCPTTNKCSTCPEGCQAIPSCPCKTSSSKPCTTKPDMCGDSDILSRVVSGAGSMTGKEESRVDGQNTLPLVQTSHKNWLPYSPQLISQYQPNYAGQSHQSSQPKSPKDQDNQLSYYASRNRGSKLRYSASANSKLSQYFKQSKDEQQPSPAVTFNEFDNSRLLRQQDQYSGSFEQQDQPQFPAQNNVVRNQIQVNYKQLHLDQGTNTDASAHAVEGTGVSDADFKISEPQNKLISQAEQNTSSRQNDAKIKKHRDSFFARLRSKFHKEIPPNGTDLNPYSHQNQQTQNKALLVSSIFRFSPRNHTLGSGKDSSSTTIQPMDNQQKCVETQTNQSNDQTLTLTNETQPSTVNNINITIASSQPQPGAPGQLQTKNQTNQPPQWSKNIIQCTNTVPPTLQTMSNGQNGRTCKVTKIWLCPQRPTNVTASPNSLCTQQSTCQTSLTTTFPTQSTCQTTQSTCQTAPTTCKTSPTASCQSLTSGTSPSTQLSTCSNSWNLSSSQFPQQVPSDNVDGADATQPSTSGAATQPSTCGADTPSKPMCGSNIPLGNSLQPENPRSPGDSQMPPSMPHPQSDTGIPGAKIKTFFNYGPYPVWNQWQYPIDRMNPHPPEQNVNWQQQTQVPIPNQYAPHVPQQKQPVQDPKLPRPTPVPPQAPQKQVEHHSFSPIPPRRQEAPWHQNLAQPQMHGPMWQQAPSQQLELDPRWQNVQPSFPNRGDNIRNEFQYRQEINPNPYEEKKWSEGNITMVNDRMTAMRKAYLPADVKQHIARVRRYLQQKKRSKCPYKHGLYVRKM